MASVGRFFGKLFGVEQPAPVAPSKPTEAQVAAERTARVASTAAHMEAQEARRQRIKQDGLTSRVSMLRNASSFLANRGTRYSGLKPTLGG